MKRGAELSLQRDAHVLEHRQMPEHRRDLERADDAPARDRGRLLVRDVIAGKQDAARGRRQELGEQVEAGRLAGAVRADQRVDRAAAHAQVHLVDGDETLELLRELVRLEDEIVAHRLAGSPPRRRVRRSATSSAASRWRAPRSPPSCALLMQTATAATASPEASKTGTPNEYTPSR